MVERSEKHFAIKYPLKYLSYSSSNTFDDCGYKFYLTKLSEHKKKIAKKIQYTQSLPAAVGSAFDCFVKDLLGRLILGHNKFNLNEMLKDSVKNHFDQACDAGQKLLDVYRQTALQYLIDDGLQEIELVIHNPIGDVPFLAKLDASLANKVPHDWKIRGYASSPKSPTPGWTRLWKKGKLKSDSHKRVHDYFEDINRYWAKQLTCYAFSLGHIPGDELRISIDEMSMRQNVGNPIVDINTVQVAQIRSKVSPEFQRKVYANLQDIWQRSLTGKFPEADPSMQRCFKFKEKCFASDYCENFQSSLGDDKLRKLLV